MRDKAILASQYQDSANLEIRQNFHKKYAAKPTAYTEWILSRIEFFAGCRVLEVGCGTGSLWENHPALVDTFSELLLTDISPGMLDIAREKYAGRKNVRLQAVDVLDMPFAPGSFDIIVANSMLYHVNDVAAALENIRRTLRQDGKFYATTFGENGLFGYIHNALFEMGLAPSKKPGEISFALENGADLLRRRFSVVEKVTFQSQLQVTEPLDLVAYIYSMASMSHLDQSHRDKICAYFENKRDRQGILAIPQEYGMFICSK